MPHQDLETATVDTIINELDRWHNTYTDTPNNYDARLLKRTAQLLQQLWDTIGKLEDQIETQTPPHLQLTPTQAKYIIQGYDEDWITKETETINYYTHIRKCTGVFKHIPTNKHYQLTWDEENKQPQEIKRCQLITPNPIEVTPTTTTKTEYHRTKHPRN